jgi:hypothetical protein
MNGSTSTSSFLPPLQRTQLMGGQSTQALNNIYSPAMPRGHQVCDLYILIVILLQMSAGSAGVMAMDTSNNHLMYNSKFSNSVSTLSLTNDGPNGVHHSLTNTGTLTRSVGKQVCCVFIHWMCILLSVVYR